MRSYAEIFKIAANEFPPFITIVSYLSASGNTVPNAGKPLREGVRSHVTSIQNGGIVLNNILYGNDYN